MAIYLTELEQEDLSFPSPFTALEEPNGLLAFGGDLSPARIWMAYQSGIFPWYGPNDPILWWSPSHEPCLIQPSFSQQKVSENSSASTNTGSA